MTQQILPEAKEVRSMLSMSEYLIADATAAAAATTTASSASSSPITTTAEKPPLPKSSRTSESKDKAVAARANKNYQWRDWRIMHHNRLTYIWSDAVAFQLNEDGTVQYLMENKIGETLLFLTTQKVEDTDAVRQEFIRLFIETKEAVSEIPLRHIFEDNKDNWIGFGSWDFLCLNGVKLEITYSGAEQSKLEIFHDIPGFTYNFDADATETFMAEQMLSSVFATGWIKVNPLKQDRKVAKRERVKQLAQDIWEKYLKHCKNNMRTELKALQANAKAIVTLFKELDYGGKSLNNEECERRLYNNLEQVRDALLNDNTLSIFEIAHSGIVKALCYILANCVQDTRGPVANTFRRVFAGDNVINTIARKIVFVLEALEKFPVLKYDKPNSSVSGMKLLTRRFRFQLEQADPKHWLQKKLLNNTGRQMKADPLCILV
uniref:E3 ubiquitin-protein ligase n=1 Tax=Panagrolaimus davidi TaxID=227884 RepID=A0A914PT53_9BILA